MRKFKMAASFGKINFFLKIGMATLKTYPVGQKFCRNRNIWHSFRDISIFVFCNFCKKFENSKWLPFWVRQIFFKIGMAGLQSYPVGQKFCRNRSILHGLRDISFFVYSIFIKFAKVN